MNLAQDVNYLMKIEIREAGLREDGMVHHLLYYVCMVSFQTYLHLGGFMQGILVTLYL